MELSKWARNEVADICKEHNDPYLSMCCESALKAFECLMDYGHSGMSMEFAKTILNRLIDGKPLTSIEDTDNIWKFSFNQTNENGDEYKVYQCRRMSSFFKSVYADGHVEYDDINRFTCIKEGSCITTKYTLVDRILSPMFPISMPYYPTEPIKVMVEDFLVDKENGDFDTFGIFSAIEPNGNKTDINKYFKYESDTWIDIDEKEYLERKKNAITVPD